MRKKVRGLYILMISVHGLIRGTNLELGRDADTGGQTLYVVELARALASHPEVERVDLLTRQVVDPRVDATYAESLEVLAPGAFIVRVPCGPRRYLRKEVLWPYLDDFADAVLQHLRRVGRVPDWLHGHYADAGYVGARLAAVLGVPLVFTGHSLGRVKRQRLLESGMKAETIELQYNIAQRIEAEELALDSAALVVASTRQELVEQYSLYDNYSPEIMEVIPPGTDLERFSPPGPEGRELPIARELARFLLNPGKPVILAISRPDERKNIGGLVCAYGENEQLRQKANLVIVAGCRQDITAMDKGPREVLTSLLLLVDKYDLYGSVAYPKTHKPEDVPDLYRFAALKKGVFVNPALTEPFGLTLIEAAASGLPVVATRDGGPRDILENCQNGLLIDPLDTAAMGEAIMSALSDIKQWRRWSKNGIRGAHRYYSWTSHVQKYLTAARKRFNGKKQAPAINFRRSQLPVVDRILVCDIDHTLLGDKKSLQHLVKIIKSNGERMGFAVATGRRVESAVDVLKAWRVPMPDVLITSVGSEIYYGERLVKDMSWSQHIDYRWQPQALQATLEGLPGLSLQPLVEQRTHKLSYYLDPQKAPPLKEIRRILRREKLQARLIFSHRTYLDLLPIRASKGLAIRFLGMKWGLPLERFLVAGDSGNDEEMLTGNTLGVVVGNHSPELEKLRGRNRIYFAEGYHAAGVLEGIEHYDFLGQIIIPEGAGGAK